MRRTRRFRIQTNLAWPTALALMLLPGCGRQDSTAPPVLHLDDSICAQCGMIISDVRFAAATVIADDQRSAPYLFDDYNCQVNFEKAVSSESILARWAHDYSDGEWIEAEQAHYLRSDRLKTPMASHVAAFRTIDAANTVMQEMGGEVISFELLED